MCEDIEPVLEGSQVVIAMDGEAAKSHSQTGRTTQVGWLAIGSGVSQLSMTLLVVVLARILGRSEYGTYRQLLLVIAMLSPLFTLALPASILYFLAKEPSLSERRRFVGQTFLLLLVAGVAMGLVLLLVASLISGYFSNPDITPYLRILALYPILLLPSRCFAPAMIVLGQSRVSAVLLALEGCSKAGILLCVVLVGGKLTAAVWGLVASAGLNFAVGSMVTARYLGTEGAFKLDTNRCVSQLVYSVPLGVAAIVSAWGLRVDQLLVSSFYDPATFALYAVGATEVPFVSLLQASINSVVLPEMTALLSAGKKGDAVLLWKKVFDRSALVTFSSFFFLLLVSESLVVGLFSAEYTRSVPIFRIYLAMMPLRVMTFGLLLRATGRTVYDLWGSVIFLLINVGLGVVLVKVVGVTGPAWSTILAFTILVSYLTAITTRKLRWSLLDVFPWRVILFHAAVAGVPFFATIVAWGIVSRYVSPPLIVKTAFLGCIYIIAYLVLLRITSEKRFIFLLSLVTFRWLFGDLRLFRKDG